MPLSERYWLKNPDVPYATLLATLQSHVHPEADRFEDLQEAVKLEDLEEVKTFKRELREVIADPSVLPEGALFTAANYEDGSAEAFLANLWRDLYGDEPV